MTETKHQIRARLRQKRAAIFNSDTDDTFPVDFLRVFEAHVALAEDDVLAAFWPTGSEPEIVPLLEALSERGVTMCLPRVQGDGPLAFHQWTKGNQLVVSQMGLEEPADSQPKLTPSVMVVPALGWTQAGHRIGYGGGHYDKTIAALRAAGHTPKLIGISYQDLEIDSFPVEETDIPLHAILTEKGYMICR